MAIRLSRQGSHRLVKISTKLEIGQNSRAMAYIGITNEDGHITWGAGMDTDIITASIQALISAINRMKAGK